VHPTQKPVGMLADILKDFSEENDSILDCFGGSGSTLIACEQTGRTCYMAELSPEYVDVIIARWEKLTGNKAVLLT
jgi:site-specific DNA-methyltransferase (adenine-specific)